MYSLNVYFSQANQDPTIRIGFNLPICGVNTTTSYSKYNMYIEFLNITLYE